MNLNQLQAFCVLANTLHYSRAAEELKLAQPSLSRTIHQLEDELGTLLFSKVGRNIALTKQGAIFYDYVNRGLNEITHGKEVLKELLSPGSGVIDFAFIYALSPTYVPQHIQKFLLLEENKNISFRFYQGNTYDILRRLKDGSCDIGFCSYAENQPLIRFEPIVKQEYVLMAARNHPLSQRKTITLEEAAEYDFILPLDKTSYVEEQFKKANIVPRAASRVEEDHAAAALVAINLGIAIIPRNVILEHYNVKLIPFETPMLRKFYMVTMKEKYLTPSALSFYNFIQKNTKKELPLY